MLQPLSHVNKFYHERQDATCYEDGNVAYYECPDCGWFFDEEGDPIPRAVGSSLPTDTNRAKLL